jgi:hypothetical protein
VFAPELLLGGGRSGKQGNKCQGGQDVLHLEVSKSFRAQETQFPRTPGIYPRLFHNEWR